MDEQSAGQTTPPADDDVLRGGDDASAQTDPPELTEPEPTEQPDPADQSELTEQPERTDPFQLTDPPEPTGRPDVDAVLDRLHELDGLPPSQHVDLYEDAHRRLHETLLAAGETREHPAQQS